MDEVALIHSAQGGNLESFNCLVLAYQDSVYNQAYRMMGDQDSASDAAQEAFISAYKSLKSYRGGSFRAWLMRIVTNACYDELRRRQRRPTTSLEPLDDAGEEIESPHWMADNSEGPEEEIERTELNLAIQRCLNDMPDEFRSVLVMIDMQGFDYTETAQSIGTPLGTVKSRLARARMKLRECMQGFGELLPSEFRQGEES